MVKVYSISSCPWCDKVKKYLKSKGIEYEERNIEKSDAYRKECEALSGDTVVPVTTVDGKNYVVSFEKDKLDAILGLK